MASKQSFARQQQQGQIDAEKFMGQFNQGQQNARQATEIEASRKSQEANRELESQRIVIDRTRQAAEQANQSAIRAMEQGQLAESRRQFEISQGLRQQQFDAERDLSNKQYQLSEQQFGLTALSFLTDLAKNPRTALASYFLNRGVTPPGQVGAGSPIPEGLNVTNIAETLPKFLKGLMGSGATPGAGAPAPAGPAGAGVSSSSLAQPGASLLTSLQGEGIVPPFLQRLLAQASGDPSQGTNMPQQTALPEGVPLISSLALLQMAPTEREGFRGFVEASGMNWDDYLNMVKNSSPTSQAAGAQAQPQYAFAAQ